MANNIQQINIPLQQLNQQGGQQKLKLPSNGREVIIALNGQHIASINGNGKKSQYIPISHGHHSDDYQDNSTNIHIADNQQPNDKFAMLMEAVNNKDVPTEVKQNLINTFKDSATA
jgi:hypothetical protein